MVALDTAAIVDLIRRPRDRRKTALSALLARLEAGEAPATTRFNVAELYAGIENARDAGAEGAKVDFVLRRLTVLEFDDRAAQVYGKLSASLRRMGRRIADMDLLIASVCVAEGHSLLTRNVRHFAGIPGLVVHSY